MLNLGVPNIIVSDSGPQYTSAEFKDFMKPWQIEHRISSPRNPQSNGMAERCVQTMKASLIKTIVPTRLQESYRQIMDQGKQVQAQLYNKNTRELPRLKQSQKVMVQLDSDKNIWTQAEIIQCPTNEGRSYRLRTVHSGVYTRNRRFIKPDLTEAGLWSQSQIVSREWPDPQGLSGSRIDSSSLKKTIINSADSLGHSLSRSKFSL